MNAHRSVYRLLALGLLLAAVLAGIVRPAPGHAGAAQDGAGIPTPVQDWPHFGYDGAYTARNRSEEAISEKNVANLERKWGIGCNDPYFSVISRSPAIYRGVLFTSGAGRKLTAYDAKSGQFLWEFGQGNTGWAPQPAVSSDGIVFYLEGSYPTYLYAVRADNGTKLWEAPMGFDLGYNDTAVVTVDDVRGVVYLVQEPFMGDGKLYALDKQTGDVVWYKSKPTDGASFAGDYVLLQENKIFAKAGVDQEHWTEDRMLRIDATSHNIEATYAKPAGITFTQISKYTLCDDKLAVVYCDRDDVFESQGTLVVYNAISQAVLWQRAFTTTAVTGKIACNTDQGVLYVPTNPHLYALNAQTGQEVWKYQGYGAIYNPSLANGAVYLLSDTNMYALDEGNGERLFHYPLGYDAYETTQVAISAGMVYFSGNGGTCDLFALGLPIDYKYQVFLPVLVRGE